MRREIFYSLPIHVFGEIHLQKEKEVEFSKWFLFQRIAFPIFFSKIKLYCRKMAPAAKSRGFRERERNLIRGSVRKKKTIAFPRLFFIFLPCFLLYYSGRNVNLPCPQFFSFLLPPPPFSQFSHGKRKGREKPGLRLGCGCGGGMGIFEMVRNWAGRQGFHLFWRKVLEKRTFFA